MKYLIILLFLTGCTTYTPTHEITNFKLDVEFDNAPKGYDGWADWSKIFTTGCVVNIPKEINDNNMCTAGHELYHCINGDYHG